MKVQDGMSILLCRPKNPDQRESKGPWPDYHWLAFVGDPLTFVKYMERQGIMEYVVATVQITGDPPIDLGDPYGPLQTAAMAAGPEVGRVEV